MTRDTRLAADITVLVAVVEAGSFTQGGTLLGLTPSGASRAVSRLEERIGVRLLDRTTRSLRLTAAGRRLHTLARPHLAGLEDAAVAAGDASETVGGRLRVAINPIVMRHLLAPSLPLLAKRYPAIALEMVAGESGDLTTGGIDLAIRFGPQPPSSMSSLHLLDTRVLTVASPIYLARHGRPETPSALLAHQCLHYIDPQRGRPFDWEFRRGDEIQPIAVTGQYSFIDIDAMVASACAGVGIAQVLKIGTEALIANGTLVDLFPNWPGETFPLFAIRPSRRLPSAAVEAFLNFCAGVCKGRDVENAANQTRFC